MRLTFVIIQEDKNFLNFLVDYIDGGGQKSDNRRVRFLSQGFLWRKTKAVHQSINQSIDRTTNQSLTQPINQLSNQSIDDKVSSTFKYKFKNSQSAEAYQNVDLLLTHHNVLFRIDVHPFQGKATAHLILCQEHQGESAYKMNENKNDKRNCHRHKSNHI